MNKKILASLSTAALIVPGVLFAAGGTVVARQGAQPNRIGEFAVRAFSQIDMRLQTNSITSDFRGPNLTVEAPQYTMKAPHIVLTAKRGGQPARMKVVNATATGGVRIVIRNEEIKRTTTVTSNSAVYTATTNPKDLGAIDLKGNVKSVVQDPGFAEPWVTVADSGQIKLISAEETHVSLTEGETRVVPVERPRRKPATSGGGNR